ncbi:MAG: NADPH-dependent FMN reductase [Acidobacteriota bacterium]
MESRPLSIPVILGTPRKGRASAHAANFVVNQIRARSGLTTELIDVAAQALPLDDAGQAIKDPKMSETLAASDALVIVSPEYNHSFPGLLKHFLDGYLEEYIHKAAGVVGVSAGPFGGTRGIQDLLPVLRELGLVTIFWDVNIGSVGKTFDEAGTLKDQALVRRTSSWTSWSGWPGRSGTVEPTSRSGEEANVGEAKLACPKCGDEMNHHADKLVAPCGSEDVAAVDLAMGGIVHQAHNCDGCGHVEVRIEAARP